MKRALRMQVCSRLGVFRCLILWWKGLGLKRLEKDVQRTVSSSQSSDSMAAQGAVKRSKLKAQRSQARS